MLTSDCTRPGSAYVPPHLRNRGGSETTEGSEAALKLTRQLKGLLNRYVNLTRRLFYSL